MLLVLTVVALALTLVVHVSPWVTEGFGVSHDGYNGAMWGLGARAARDDPIGNRLGGVQPHGYRYANHPPLLVWSATASTAVGGERPVMVRAPALLASLAALVILALVLRDAGFSPAETAAGLAVGGTSAMFLTYGAMADTPVLALPFGLAAIGAAQRAWQGRPPPRSVMLAIGVLATLAGWQALLAAALATGLTLLAPSPEGRRAGRLLGAGALAGLAVTLAWIAWVKGTLLDLADQATLRGGSGQSWLDRQGTYLFDLYGPAALAVLGAGLAIGLTARHRAAGTWTGPRPLLAVLAATVGLYVLVFRQASAEHDYWTYWGVALLAASAAALTRGTMRLGRRLPPGARWAGPTVVTLAVIALAVTGAGRRSDADRTIQIGLGAVPVLAAAPRAATPTEATLAVRDGEAGVPWANWATHGRALRPTRDEVAALPPDRLLFMYVQGPISPALRAAALAVEGPWVLAPAQAFR